MTGLNKIILLTLRQKVLNQVFEVILTPVTGDIKCQIEINDFCKEKNYTKFETLSIKSSHWEFFDSFI